MKPPGRPAWALLLVLLLLAACAAPAPEQVEPPRRAGPIGSPAGPWREQAHWIPVREADGTERLIELRICRPLRPEPHRIAVINHGKSPFAADRARLRTADCGAQAVQWFLDRDFAVLLPLRRGYGVSGGVLAEAYPVCDRPRDYALGALETARDITAALDYAAGLPDLDRGAAVVVGQSAGGLGTIALSSLNDPRIGLLVNMAGGDGGRMNGVPNAVCQPDALVRAAARFGATARTPMVWIYTANDSYFAPPIAAAMHRAYVAAGGRARLVQLPAFGSDGHTVFFANGGSAIWGRAVDPLLPRRAGS